MKDSVTYQAMLDEGRSEGITMGAIQQAKKLLLHLESKRFGSPTPPIRAAIEAIEDLQRLEHLVGERLLEVGSWDELCNKNGDSVDNA